MLKSLGKPTTGPYTLGNMFLVACLVALGLVIRLATL